MDPGSYINVFRNASQAKSAAGRRQSKRPKNMEPSTGVRNYSDEEFAFLRAVEAYQQKHGVRFPTVCMYLQILKQLGYTKAAQPQPQPKPKEAS